MDDPRNGEETDRVGKISNAFEMSGRKRGSWSQQRCVSDHRSPVKLGCVGRSGRCPCITENMAIADELSLNGTSPVKIYSNPIVIVVKFPRSEPAAILLTSITTIAKENISPSLVCSRLIMTSGAAQRTV